MTRQAIIDTGPLVAYLDRAQSHHDWVVDQVEALRAPFLVCEAVLTEAMFLLKRIPVAQIALFKLLQSDALEIKFSLAENVIAVNSLMAKYLDNDISLADACIVRMTELYPEHAVFTLDSDFHIYRKHGRQSIQLIVPARKP